MYHREALIIFTAVELTSVLRHRTCFLRFSDSAGKQRRLNSCLLQHLMTPDSSTSSDCSSVPLRPGGSALSLFFFTGLFIFPQLSVGVRGAQAKLGKGDLQGDFTEKAQSCGHGLLPSDIWGSSVCWEASGWRRGGAQLSISATDNSPCK